MPIALIIAALGLLGWFALKRDDAGYPAGADAPAPGPLDDVFDTVTTGARKLFELPARAAPYADAIAASERNNALPDGLLGRVLWSESRFRQDIIDGTVRSSVGAAGIAQFLPRTSEKLGIDPLDPFAAIDAAASELRKSFNHFGTWSDALIAYNWGWGNMERKGVKNAPASTQSYVSDILRDIGQPTI